MKLVYKKEGEGRRRFGIYFNREERDAIFELIDEPLVEFYSDGEGFKATTLLVAKALNVSLPEHALPFDERVDDSYNILSEAKLDIDNPDDRKALLEAVRVYITNRLAIASKMSREETIYSSIPYKSLSRLVTEVKAPELKIEPPLLLFVDGKIFELKEISESRDMSRYITNRMRSLSNEYRRTISLALQAIKNEYLRKLGELKDRMRSVIPLPRLTLDHVKQGLYVVSFGNSIGYVKKVSVTVKRLMYGNRLFLLFPEHRVTIKGYILIRVNREGKLLDVRFYNEDLTGRANHPHVLGDADACIGNSRVRNMDIIGPDEALKAIDEIVRLYETINLGDMAYTPLWLKDILNKFNKDHSLVSEVENATWSV